MSAVTEAEAERQGLWEQLNQTVSDASERIDRLLMGEDNYEHFLRVSDEVRRLEHQRDLERMQAIARLSRRNRSEP